MNDRPLSAANADDDWLEAALRADGREHRADYLDDAGFTARVMAALPAPVALPAWRRPALTAALGAARDSASRSRCPAPSSTSRTTSCASSLGQRVSLAGIGAAVVALGVATWAAAAVALRDD